MKVSPRLGLLNTALAGPAGSLAMAAPGPKGAWFPLRGALTGCRALSPKAPLPTAPPVKSSERAGPASAPGPRVTSEVRCAGAGRSLQAMLNSASFWGLPVRGSALK